MKINEWDQNLRTLGLQIKQVADHISPSGNAEDYLGELERDIRKCEQRIAQRTQQITALREQQQDRVLPATKALFYWSAVLAEKIQEVVTTATRVSLKDHWLKLFCYRYSGKKIRDNDQNEWLAMIAQQKRLKEAESYLEHQETELLNDIARLEQQLTRYDTENFNSAAMVCMQTERGELHAAELNAMNHLESYLRIVEFMSHRSTAYRAQAVDELTKIDNKLEVLLDKCRELALDTLDFDSESERLIRKQRFREYRDQLAMLDHKLEKISQIFQSSRLKSLHPVLKKTTKQANTTTVRKYRPTSLNELG